MNVLSQRDAARLLRWAMLWGNNHPEEGLEIRKLIQQMKIMLAAEDLLMLAQLAEEGGFKWLSDELRSQAFGGENGK